MSSDNVPNKDETQTTEADAAAAAEACETIITAEQFAELQAKAAKADETWDRYVRLNADFDNFRKRAARDREDGVRAAQERLLGKLLPVVDNFDMAMAATGSAQNTILESLKAGVQMIQGQLKAVLSESGVEEIDAIGKPFDPNLHEALSQMESADAPEGTVLQQLRKGYKMRDRLLRPASVIVAKKPAAAESTEAKA